MSEQHRQASSQEPRTLEMRVAAIEDRLAQLTISEEEMRAYQKVAALMAGRTAAAPAAGGASSMGVHGISPISPIVINPISIYPITGIRPIVINPIIVADCIQAGMTGPVAGGLGFARFGQ